MNLKVVSAGGLLPKLALPHHSSIAIKSQIRAMFKMCGYTKGKREIRPKRPTTI